MSSFERDYLLQDGKTQKWGAGKGKVRTAWIKFKGRNWIDIRMLKRKDDGYEHTRGGVRFTPNQIRELLPVLVEILDHIDSHSEEEERRIAREEDESIPSPLETTE